MNNPAPGSVEEVGAKKTVLAGASPLEASSGPVVHAVGVTKAFRRSAQGFRWPWKRDDARVFYAVNRVDLDIYPDEIVGLVGESGSGKTTLGKLLLRLYELDAGQVFLEGQDIHRLPRGQLRGLRPRYQMVFQNPHSSLNPGMRAGEMLLETLQLHLGLRGEEAQARMREALATVQLSDKEGAYPSQLSGGERRRVGLARILLLKPRLIIADEPTAGLDASLKAGIVQLMLETRAPGMAYLFISHDLHLIRYVAGRILVMLRGRVVEEVPAGCFELGLLHHPYTELLLQSFHLGRGRAELTAAASPSPAENLSLPDGAGCCYYPHCARARLMGAKAEICKNSEPLLTSGPDGGRIACHFV